MQRVREFFLKQNLSRYKKGDVIMRVDDDISGAYFLEKGYVKVYSLTESGEENIIFIYQPGDLFPVIWVLKGENPDVFYEAMTPIVIRKSQKDLFLSFLREDSEALFEVTVYTAYLLDAFYERIHNLALTHSYPRLISQLLFLAKRLGRKEKGKIVFDFPISQKDLAHTVNMTRETASKEINELVRKGIIECRGRSELIIKNVKKLEKELLLH